MMPSKIEKSFSIKPIGDISFQSISDIAECFCYNDNPLFTFVLINLNQNLHNLFLFFPAFG